MDCKEVREYLYSFLDGELDSQINTLVKEHLSLCPLCSIELEQEKTFNTLIEEGVSVEKAPYELRERIINSLEERRIPFSVFQLRTALVGICVILSLVFFIFKPSPFPVFKESIIHHISFLQNKIPIEISSDSPAEVKKWLQDKVDFMAMVPILSPQGVNMLGARVCCFGDKKAAYIMYEKEGHNISVFMFDAKGLRFPKAKQVAMNNKKFYIDKEKGYNSALWVEDDIACVFVSDINEAELVYLASV